MNIQAVKSNKNYYRVPDPKKTGRNDLIFSSLLNQSKAIQSISTEFSSDEINADNNTSFNHQSSVIIGGVYWDDKKFADLIERFEHVTINTDNPINWGTTGEHKLTESEIEVLKNKYDVTNLSEQEFYDLMADLSHLNAIKPSDIYSRYQFKEPVAFFEGAGLLFTGTITEKDYHNGKPINNLLEELYGRVDYYAANNESINSSEFVRLNKFVFNQKRFQHLLMDLKVNAQECCQEAERYYGIIAQLKR